eukprot:scaffold67906_cov49-Attheya_sp.AAC.1
MAIEEDNANCSTLAEAYEHSIALLRAMSIWAMCHCWAVTHDLRTDLSSVRAPWLEGVYAREAMVIKVNNTYRIVH